jgi:biopolymer transport protein ExbB/TolQ
MKKLKNLSTAFILSIIMIFLFILGFDFAPVELPMIRRLMLLLGGNFLGGGYVQFMTYIAFFWGLFEIKERFHVLGRERRAFTAGIIPMSEKHIFISQDIHQLKFKLQDYDKKQKYLLTDLLKKICYKFRSADSIGELIDLVSLQVEIYQEKAESDQSLIRYLTWVIPSLGFIGTVIGLSQALMIANSGDMNAITEALAVAFDTTLVALVLSIFIMWFFHDLQERTDHLHSDLKEFVIDSFINKIERS